MAEDLWLYVPNEMGRGLQQYRVTSVGGVSAGANFQARVLRDSHDQLVVQKTGYGGPAAERLLRNEVRMGRMLLNRLGRKEYPDLLSQLIGFNPDVSPPYAVFTHTGGTLAGLEAQLPLPPALFAAIVDKLIIALCYLEAAQVVHRRIRPETVGWDGTSIRLAEFGYAASAGEEAPGPPAEVPWDLPVRVPDCRDDIYAAALLITRLATGQDFGDAAAVLDAIDRLDLSQRRLLNNTRAEQRASRPTASDLRRLRRLRPLNPVLVADLGAQQKAWARFADLRRRQAEYARRKEEERRRQEQAERRRKEDLRRQEEQQRRLAETARQRAAGTGTAGASGAARATRPPPRASGYDVAPGAEAWRQPGRKSRSWLGVLIERLLRGSGFSGPGTTS